MTKLQSPSITLRTLTRGESALQEIFLNPPTLETPRLQLRRMCRRDARDIYVWSSDPEVARYVLWDAHQSLAETREYVRYIRSLYRKGLPSSWAVVLKETDQVIGTIGIMGWNPDHHCAEVGYSFGKPYWHHGYAPEALTAVLNLLIGRGGLNRVEAMCDVRNPASARVMEKCGMQREGILRQKVHNKGEYADVMLYAILAEDHYTNSR